MKSTRRLLSILLCLVMCLSLLPTAFAADDALVSSGFAGPGTTFKLYSSGKLVINGSNYPVKYMSQWSFDDDPTYYFQLDDIRATRSAIKELVIEEGIIALDDDVFRDCPNLTRVSLPESLTYIGDGAFRNCSGLTAITIPSGVTGIGDEAFMGCVSLANLLFTKGVAYIGESAFEDCTKLGSVTFPAGASVISDRAFANCKALKTIAFLGSFEDSSSPFYGVYIDETEDAFLNVTADVYYPVDNESWNDVIDPMNVYNDFGGRLTWKAAAAQTSSEGWVLKPTGWYYYVGGKMLTSNWKAYGGKWFYFGADGLMYTGRKQIDGNYYYFGQGTDGYPLGARVSGLVHDPDDGNDYFYDENGVWQPSYSGVDDNGLDYMKSGWQRVPDVDGAPWFYIRNKAKVTGWLWSNGYWYYLDPTTGAMVTGWLTWNGNTYYLRPLAKAIEDGIPSKEGSMIAGRSATIGGTVYTFDNSGALIGGKIEENPMGLATGFQNKGSAATPDWKFYGSDGKMATGWLLLDGTWYYFNSNGTMQTGWQYINGAWYYLTKWEYDSGNEDLSTSWSEIDMSVNPKYTDAGKMVTGFNKIPYTMNGTNTVRTYFFKSSGALNGNGWIKVGLKWYYLEAKGVVRVGWFRDGSKWYYLRDDTDPIGEMVTGEFDVPATLSDGTSNDPQGTGKQYFAASGEWLGSTPSWSAAKSGSWAKHDGDWYYYNADGDDYKDGNNNAVTGWINSNGKWYYLDPSSSPVGKMLTGWQDIDGERYYFDTVNGDAKGGWQKIDGVWYYLYPSHDGQFGKMMTGWQYINGNWYYLNEDKTSSAYGALQDGWIKKVANDKDSNLYWFYLEENESSNVYGAQWGGGWKQIQGKWYFFDNQHIGYYGKLIQGKWVLSSGKWYYLRSDVPNHPEESYMVTGLVDVPAAGNFPDDSTTWPAGTYYFDSNGAYQKLTGWQKIDGSWYYFNTNSTVMKDAWINEGSNTYRLGSDGKMLTGWQTVSGSEYYFDPGDGHAWKNADMDGQHLGADGKKV